MFMTYGMPNPYLFIFVLCLAGLWTGSLACLGGGSNNDDENSVVEDSSSTQPPHPEPMIAAAGGSEKLPAAEPMDADRKANGREITDKSAGRSESVGSTVALEFSFAPETAVSTTTVTSREVTSTIESTSASAKITTTGEAPKDEDLLLSPRVVQTYLHEFGYLSSTSFDRNDSNRLPNDPEFRAALQQFQEFVGVRPATGKLDLKTTEQLLFKRCANPDVNRRENVSKIWERSTLKWYLAAPNGTSAVDWLPKSIALKDLRELIREAFSAWEIVISMEFAEEPSNADAADVVFTIGEGDERRPDDGTPLSGLGVASGTSPEKSRIWLKQDENWSTFQVQEENKIDIFLALIHEIGHALGLDHSRDPNSVMFPALEREIGAQLPVISNDDVERLRALYDPDDEINVVDDTSTALDHSSGNATSPAAARKCPATLWAAAQVWPRGDVFVFMDVNVWRFDKNRRLVSGPALVAEMFPNGPPYADVAVSADGLLVLIQERNLYGYTVDELTGKIQVAKGYPKELHSRVLFYPEAAFPLTNGSVILLRDNVFATYDLVANEPSILNDKNVAFPNLPASLRAGLFADAPSADDRSSNYWMITADTVVDYRLNVMTVSGGTQPLAQFLHCDEVGGRTAAGAKHQTTTDQKGDRLSAGKTAGPAAKDM